MFDITAQEALTEQFDMEFPDWEIAEARGTRYLSERDFALDTEDADVVSNEDWDWYLSETFVDFAERVA